MKLVWRVAEAPTGRYRSFEYRGWPTCSYADGTPAAALYCEDDYTPRRARGTWSHGPILMKVYHHQHPERGNSWKVMSMTRPATTLAEAKQRVEAFLAEHPEFAPKALDVK